MESWATVTESAKSVAGIAWNPSRVKLFLLAIAFSTMLCRALLAWSIRLTRRSIVSSLLLPLFGCLVLDRRTRPERRLLDSLRRSVIKSLDIVESDPILEELFEPPNGRAQGAGK